MPQQPPTTLRPFFKSLVTSSANSSGVTLNLVLPFFTSGSPAFGLRITGTEAFSNNSSATFVSCFGPKEQFAPIAVAPIPSKSATIAEGVAPVISLPSSLYALETKTGNSQFSFTARSAALVS